MISLASKKTLPWKVLATLVLTLGLGFTACTQGQGPGGEGSNKAGTETPPPPVDVCERPENLDNILCQWVATEAKTSNDGTQWNTAEFKYDSQGRPTQITQNNSKAAVTFSYNDRGIEQIVVSSSPDPVTQDFTVVETRKYDYPYPLPSSFLDISIEKKDNGSLKEKSEVIYETSPLQIETNTFDVSKVPPEPTGTSIQYITKDSDGKITSVEQKTRTLSVTDPMTDWRVSTRGYYDMGRLKRLEMRHQDCSKTTCPSSDLANLSTNFTPTETQTVDYSYDELGRIKTFKGSTVPPNPSGDRGCEFEYDIQTQARLAGQHPMEVFMSLAHTEMFLYGFNERDLFSTWTCKTGDKVDSIVKFKWARLWEVLPEGKPPGK